MYIIINNTTRNVVSLQGDYPIELSTTLRQLKHDIIIISLYSNTIKIPDGEENLNGIIEYKWKEYPLPIAYIGEYINKVKNQTQ